LQWRRILERDRSFVPDYLVDATIWTSNHLRALLKGR
jgi:hypothetical protein